MLSHDCDPLDDSDDWVVTGSGTRTITFTYKPGGVLTAIPRGYHYHIEPVASTVKCANLLTGNTVYINNFSYEAIAP